jgi:hypothetical protein
MERTIVTLCGSTRFFAAFERANYEETMKGHVVLSVGFAQLDRDGHREDAGCTPEQKVDLDELHLYKIAMSAEILVLNVGGYVGESTKREIAFAIWLGIGLRWLEPEAGEKFLEDNSFEIVMMCGRFMIEARDAQGRLMPQGTGDNNQ